MRVVEYEGIEYMEIPDRDSGFSKCIFRPCGECTKPEKMVSCTKFTRTDAQWVYFLTKEDALRMRLKGDL